MAAAEAARGASGVIHWMRSELGILLLAAMIGIAAGSCTLLMSAAARWLHVMFFGAEARQGLSTLTKLSAAMLLIPALGGLVLGLLNFGLGRWWPRRPVDPIEANALHGGRMSVADSVMVAVQNIISNGFGASVGMEAAYTQVGGGVASRLGTAFQQRRKDLRILVGCGAAGGLAAAFCAPLTGAFYAFELVIGSSSFASLAPVSISALTAALMAWLFGEPIGFGFATVVAAPRVADYLAAAALGVICAIGGIALMRGVALAESIMRRAVPQMTLRPMVGGLLVGALAIATPGVLSAGHGILHVVMTSHVGLSAIAILLVCKVAASIVSIGSGLRGGLFFASLLIGALIGTLFAAAVEQCFGISVDARLFAIIGVSAFGASVIGAPLAMVFYAAETSQDFGVVCVALLSVVVASAMVRRLFGYSLATWRFHLSGNSILSPHDIGWVRDLTVGKLMRRDVNTVPSDMKITAFRQEFPLGSTSMVVVIDKDNRYAGIVSVATAHASNDEMRSISDFICQKDDMLLSNTDAQQAIAKFTEAKAEALVVVDSADNRFVVGTLKEAYVLRRYGEELEKLRSLETGLA
jgi:CIC family chloride channel protein